MTPLRIKNLRLQGAAADQEEWLRASLDREYRQFGTAVERTLQTICECSGGNSGERATFKN